MRCFILIFWTLISHAMALTQEVDAFKSAVQTGDSQMINRSLATLGLAIEAYEPYDGSLYNNPSPDRLAARSQIKQALEPIKSDLIQIASSSDRANAYSAIGILGSTGGGAEVYELLKDTLTNTNDSGLAVSSLSALDKLGLIDSTIENIVSKRIADVNVNDNSGKSVPLGLISEAGEIPIPPALNTFIKVLESAPSIWGKAAAAEAIMRLGPGGASALPELEKQLALFKASHADFRAINRLTRAISVVKGEAKPEEEKSASESNTSTPPQPSTSASIAPSVPPSQAVPSSPINTSNTSIPLWIYSVILLTIALFIGMWFLLKAKKNNL